MSRCSIAAWCLMVLCSIIFFTYSAGQNRSVTQLQKDIAGEIIRFHVRANSDTDADQQLKLYVKEELVKYMGELLKDASDRSDAENILNENIENIENVAKGKHTLELTVYGNRHNSFGAIHIVNEAERWFGPGVWRTSGDNWSYEYKLKRFGILKSPIITLMK